MTPQLPEDPKDLRLEEQSVSAQKAMIVQWFFERYGQSSGLPIGGHGSAPHGALTLTGSYPLGADDILRLTFGSLVSQPVIGEVISWLDGLWERRLPLRPVTAYATDDETRQAVVDELDIFEKAFRTVEPRYVEYGGPGHNGPPDNDTITVEEKNATLLAVAEMRLAVTSGAEPSVLDGIWSGIVPVTEKVGAYALARLDDLCKAAAVSVGQKLPWIILAGYAVLHHGTHISKLLDVLRRLN